jgi:Zn ribbon nucleic-acid-binding protein
MKLYNEDCLEKFECANCGCYFMVEDRSNFECPNCEEDSFRLIEDYTINMIDNLPIGEAIKVVSYYDSRPLTDETLKELGFEKQDDGSWWYMCSQFDIKLMKSGHIIDVMKINGIHKYKRVGRIKMLIEALKGDE